MIDPSGVKRILLKVSDGNRETVLEKWYIIFMGRASREKKTKKLQTKPLIKEDFFESHKTKTKLFSKPFLYLTLIAITGIVIYSNTFNVPFVFDDISNIVENYRLRDLGKFWPPGGSRWFGLLTFALNYKLGGLNPSGYHIANLIIHILNAILVYFLVIFTFKTPFFRSQVAKDRGQSGSIYDSRSLIALFSALLFISHPIQTQAVTYTVQRFTSLATLFYLLSLIMYIKARLIINQESELHATRYVPYAISLVSAILAMKTKEIAFTLPFIIVLYEFCFFSKPRNPKRLLHLLPFLLPLFIIPLSLVGMNKPLGDVIGELRDVAQETEKIPRLSYLFTQFRVIVTYIRLLFLPINQNLDYDYPVYRAFLNPNVFISFLFLLLLFSLAIYLLHHSRLVTSDRQVSNFPQRITYHHSRLIAFGIFWFFITLSVESSIIPIRDVIFEHRLYLPSIGFFIAFMSVTEVVIRRLRNRISFIEKAVVYVIVLVVIALSVTAYARNTIWQDETRLWEDVVKKSPDKARAHNNLGIYYFNRGRIDEAIREYQTALKLNPDYADVHNNLGIYYSKKGRIDEAIREYQTALKLNPDFPAAHYNLGNAYLNRGRIDEAIREYQTALKLNPDFPVAHNNLGNAYLNQGRIDEAIREYQTALKLRPDLPEARHNLEILYKRKAYGQT